METSTLKSRVHILCGTDKVCADNFSSCGEMEVSSSDLASWLVTGNNDIKGFAECKQCCQFKEEQIL